MTNTVLIKRSNAPGSAPTAGQIQQGELAINYSDGTLYYKNASNVVTVLASNQFVSVSGNVTAGNIVTSGFVSATGNVLAGNFVGSGSNVDLVAGSYDWTFDNTGNLTLPGNTFAVNYANGTPVTFTTSSYGNANVAAYLPTYTGNLVSLTGPIITTANISATGNIVSSGFFIGDGSQLTGISASGNRIESGTSNVAVVTANGNVDVAINGLVQSAQFSEGAFYSSGPIATPKTINHLSLVHENVNAVMVSPVTISAAGNVFVPTNSTLTIFTPS